MGNASRKFETSEEAAQRHRIAMDASDIEGMDVRARQKFDELSTIRADGTKVLSLPLCKKLMVELKYPAPEKHIEGLFTKAAENISAEVLAWEQFDEVMQASVSVPDMTALFVKYEGASSLAASQGGSSPETTTAASGDCATSPTSSCRIGNDPRKAKLLKLEDFKLFLMHEQGMSSDEAAAAMNGDALVTEAERAEGGISLHRFCMLLGTVATNPAFHPDLMKVYQDMTQPLSNYFICSSHNTFLETDQLKGKSSALAVKNAIQKGARVVELDCWNGPHGAVREHGPVVLHGHTATTTETFRNCIEGIKEVAFKMSEYPLCITLEDHLNASNQKKVARILREVLGDMLFIPGADGRAFGEGVGFRSPEDLKGKIIIRHKQGECLSPEEARKKHQKLTEAGMELEDIHEHYQEDVELKQEHAKAARTVKKKAIAPELVALTYVQKVHVKWDELPLGTSSSFGEKKVTHFSRHSKKARQMLEYAEGNLVRSYPGGTRVLSSNYCPQMAWDMGVQIAALNFQTNTRPMWLCLGKFRQNGNCGYVLRPPLPHDKYGTQQSRQKRIMAVTVLSAHFLPNPEGEENLGFASLNPFVHLRMYGSGADNHPSGFCTRIVHKNGFNPSWRETFAFPIADVNMATLCFELYSSKHHVGSSVHGFIAQTAIPLPCVQKGYRSVALFDCTGQVIPSANLFVHTQFVNASDIAALTGFGSTCCSPFQRVRVRSCEADPPPSISENAEEDVVTAKMLQDAKDKEAAEEEVSDVHPRIWTHSGLVAAGIELGVRLLEHERRKYDTRFLKIFGNTKEGVVRTATHLYAEGKDGSDADTEASATDGFDIGVEVKE